jgi:hyperosmotically inducible periplasmic protein
MHPFRELPRRRPRAWLLGMRMPMRRDRRGSGRLQDRSARDLAAVAASALAAGAALEFFLDPRSGKRRRHLVRDRTRAAFRRQARKVERQGHYEAGKLAGVAHAIKHREHAISELDDVSLVRKVESELFRDRTIPKGPISINADRGIVVLRGQLEDAEQIQRIEREVRDVAGVRDVENLLHPAGRPGAVKPSTRRPTRDARRVATARMRSARPRQQLFRWRPPS